MFQFGRFPRYTYVFSITWYSLPVPGFPIRKSSDQCIFATPRSLSQLVASFIGSRCQGIPLVLLFAWTSFFFVPYVSFANRVIFANLAVGYPSEYPYLWKILKDSWFFCLFASLFLDLLTFLYSVFKVHRFSASRPACGTIGGLKWIRTTDLALIRRTL